MQAALPLGERIRGLGEGGLIVCATFLALAGVIALAHLIGITDPPPDANTGVGHIVAGSLSFGAVSLLLALATRYRKLGRAMLRALPGRRTQSPAPAQSAARSARHFH